jgi:hypothetical protein
MIHDGGFTVGPVPVWPYHVDVLHDWLHHATGNPLLGRFRSLPDNDSDLLELLELDPADRVADDPAGRRRRRHRRVGVRALGGSGPEPALQHPRYGAYRPVRQLSAAAAGRS